MPVDSEHAAIAQCLRDREPAEVEGIVLTASGGPFRTRRDLSDVTPEEALARVAGDRAIITDAGAHHYRFIGVEIRPRRAEFIASLVTLGNDERSVDEATEQTEHWPTGVTTHTVRLDLTKLEGSVWSWRSASAPLR